MLMMVVEDFAICGVCLRFCSHVCKWTCLRVGIRESVMRSCCCLGIRLAQGRFCSAGARVARNTDWNSTFGTKLYCKALYQLDR